MLSNQFENFIAFLRTIDPAFYRSITPIILWGENNSEEFFSRQRGELSASEKAKFYLYLDQFADDWFRSSADFLNE